jgi:hypothetical protein
MRAIREGRDVRALTAVLDRIYTTEDQFEEPTTLDAIDELTADEARQYWRILQVQGRSPDWTVDDLRANLAALCPHCCGTGRASEETPESV